jgi:hypothetical protein
MKTLQKTNRKEIYIQVEKYILSCINGDGYDVILRTDKEKLQFICDTFKKEYAHNLNYYGSIQKTFENWLMGLPSCFNIEYRNHAIIELAKQWGSLEKDSTEKEEEKILNSWFGFVYMRFIGLCKKNGIKF